MSALKRRQGSRSPWAGEPLGVRLSVPAGTPSLNEDFYESTSVLGLDPSKVDWRDKLSVAAVATARTATTAREGHDPLEEALGLAILHARNGRRHPGPYVADIEWTATITKPSRHR
jgi:hypothetical protein